MSDFDRQEPHFSAPQTQGPHGHPDQTFCTYLAKQFVAKLGFHPGCFPEAQKLAAGCDIILTVSDGYTLSMVCLVDRDAHPGQVFDLAPEDVLEIGDACLKYTGRVSRSKMPVFIQILEVGPESADQRERLDAFKRTSPFSKVLPTAMVVDTVAGQVWSCRRPWIGKARYADFIEKMLTSPREDEATLVPLVVEMPPPAFPLLTATILAALVAVFALEIVFGVAPWTGALQPTIATLVAMGALARPLVLAGEWYRLLAAPFLHLDVFHLALNSIALYMAGVRLERLIGRAWFGTIYLVSALCGALASLALNPATIVSVGASGAIMGLFAAMLVVSWHYPIGATRTGLQTSAIYVLLPSLLPLTSALQGHKVDYGAHLGGAIGGVVLALVMLAIWPRTSPWPNWRRAAAAVACAGVIALAYPVTAGLQHMSFFAQLIPADKYPATNADAAARAAQLVQQYPHDPRAHLLLAGQLLDAHDNPGAEREAQAGLSDEASWHMVLPEGVSFALRAVLAAAIMDERHDEAIAIAKPLCGVVRFGPVRRLIDSRHLCG